LWELVHAEPPKQAAHFRDPGICLQFENAITGSGFRLAQQLSGVHLPQQRVVSVEIHGAELEHWERLLVSAYADLPNEDRTATGQPDQDGYPDHKRCA
jgi:hypothetical protein